MSTNITFHPGAVEKNERTQLLGQKGLTLWLTGLSASGKSTIAVALEQQLLQSKKLAYRLDGDNVRFGLNKDLGFSEKDRNENIRRISEVAKLFNDAAAIAITSFISPYRSDRQFAREIHEKAGLTFVEVYIDAPLSVVEARDPKGLYKKARAGEIKDFTGISAPYEPPEKAEIHIHTDHSSVEDSSYILDTMATTTTRPIVFMDINIGETPAGRLKMELFSDIVPKTAENFRQLCTGEHRRVLCLKPLLLTLRPVTDVRDFMVQGGDFLNGDGTGSFSIYGDKFPDENFEMKHTGPGLLSMANSGPNTNGCQFFITAATCDFLDGKHVVFGKVIDGILTLRKIENVATGPNNRPKLTVKITGEILTTHWQALTAFRAYATDWIDDRMWRDVRS
ncbi:unnamed protein product [Rhizoctonia solani]|uniref:Adenylyl-sulfate kinase n=1 Tax=Rhizoctonia solani TaxID=456999 RepID=A0A8H3GZZ1_9AGAM|nr:unnamed protein product [Rhizoctonia solani]CAE6476883.1 unnamed protein product [Rhizoctonia solani]